MYITAMGKNDELLLRTIVRAAFVEFDSSLGFSSLLSELLCCYS